VVAKLLNYHARLNLLAFPPGSLLVRCGAAAAATGNGSAPAVLAGRRPRPDWWLPLACCTSSSSPPVRPSRACALAWRGRLTRNQMAGERSCSLVLADQWWCCCVCMDASPSSGIQCRAAWAACMAACMMCHERSHHRSSLARQGHRW
jgi:hypothetical protein